MRKKSKRKYLVYLDKGIDALLAGIDRINSVYDAYKIEESFFLITNAWELLSKAIILRDKGKILYSDGRSLSAEDSLLKLVSGKYLLENQAYHIHQVISIRNEATHSILPEIPQEIIFHLEFYAIKFFKDIVSKEFPAYSKRCSGNFLSLSFDTLTTYADKVQKLVSKARKKGSEEQALVWLLERGIRFSGGHYISQNKFEEEIKNLGRKKRLYPHLQLSNFVKDAEMVVVVPVQAPKGYTADINLRKGSDKASLALPVMIKKTDIEIDYPYLTSEIANKLNKNISFVVKTIGQLGFKGNSIYHQSVRSSKSGTINKYSQKALDFLEKHLKDNPGYSPFKKQ